MQLEWYNSRGYQGGGSAKLYNIVRDRRAFAIDHKVQPKDWLETAETVNYTEQLEELDI